MPLESATWVNQLDQTRPTSTDVKSEGDDVMRLIKSTLKNSFPNVGGAMNASHTELNRLVGVTEDVQPRLSASLSAPNGETLNRLPAAASRQGGFLTFNASTGQPEIGFSLTAASGNSLGIFSVSSSTTFFTNGAERVRIGPTGNLGVGTNNPGELLDLLGSTRAFIRVTNVSNAGVLYAGPTSVTNEVTISADAGGNFLTLRTGSTERIRIDTVGNVISNVNTTAPTLSTNQQMVFALTSNTNLRISVRGTDGTTRVANLTLA
jgi:hypothetical protein